MKTWKSVRTTGKSPERVAKVAAEVSKELSKLTTADLIAEECDALKVMLQQKNAAYGDSALSPVRVFSRASIEEQILVRLDDKLSRLARGSAAGEDVVQDLLGYLVLLRVARRRAKAGG